MTDTTEARPMRLYERLLFGTTIDQVPSLIPGFVLAVAVVVVAVVVAEFINSTLGFDGLVSFILVAIVLGMVIRNTIGLADRFAPGIAYTHKNHRVLL